MKIKKYSAHTLKDAISQMKSELGPDAVVLSTKVIEGDIELGTRKKFEVTAGLENGNNGSAHIGLEEKKKEPAANLEKELKSLSEKIYGKKQNLNETKTKTTAAPKPKKKKNPEAEKAYKTNGALNEISDLLIQRDVEERLVNKIVGQIKNYTSLVESKNLDNYVISTISSMLPVGNSHQKKKGSKIVSVVGPTGVGKTTCIAKLAVISKILHNLDVGLISIDTYRLGALDQLKIFSEVSNIDFLVAYEPSDVTKHLAKFKKKDIVFIDTVGRSQNNPKLLNGINDFLKVGKIDETYLVLNSTSTTKNMMDVAEKFKVLNYNGLIFSKLDEAVSYGNILNLSNRINVPIKYLTNGQVIPDDIIAADPEFMANMIYTGKISK
jgi:flagellar biosynthesis protein FlhF